MKINIKPPKINIKFKVQKIYPKLEDLKIKPSGQEQVFKSDKDGYETVIVSAVESQELEIVPSKEEQVSEGLFNKVTILGDNNLIPQNIKEGISIFGIQGTMSGAWDSSQIRECYRMFYNNKEMIECPYFDTSNVTNMNTMFYGCSNLKTVPQFDTRNVTNMSYMFCNCSNLETVPELNTTNVTNMSSMFSGSGNLKVLPKFEAGKVTSIDTMSYNCTKLTEFGGLSNIGKAYTQKTSNYTSYTVNLSRNENLTHDSLMNVINNLYDLNLTYDVANGGTLYTQSLNLGWTNRNKLTAEEIAIATNKGWNVS